MSSAGCGSCAERAEARARARAEVVAARSGHPSPTSRAVAAAANPLWEVFGENGASTGRRFTSYQAAQMYIGKGSGTIRQVR
jgi:hypothetical protein